MKGQPSCQFQGKGCKNLCNNQGAIWLDFVGFLHGGELWHASDTRCHQSDGARVEVGAVAAGWASAKARGRTGGRPTTDVSKLENALVLYENSDVSSAEICATFGLGRRTFFNYTAGIRANRNGIF